MLKNLPANAGDTGDVGSIPGSGRSPGERNGNTPQYSCRGNPMERGGCKESDMTQQLSTHTHIPYVCAISLSTYTINIRLLLYMETQASCRKMEDIHYP